MQPLKFEGCDIVYGATQEEYQPLPAERVGRPEIGQINTCWELSPEELEIVKKTGKIWLSVLTFGQPLQPILLSAEKPDICELSKGNDND